MSNGPSYQNRRARRAPLREPNASYHVTTHPHPDPRLSQKNYPSKIFPRPLELLTIKYPPLPPPPSANLILQVSVPPPTQPLPATLPPLPSDEEFEDLYEDLAKYIEGPITTSSTATRKRRAQPSEEYVPTRKVTRPLKPATTKRLKDLFGSPKQTRSPPRL